MTLVGVVSRLSMIQGGVVRNQHRLKFETAAFFGVLWSRSDLGWARRVRDGVSVGLRWEVDHGERLILITACGKMDLVSSLGAIPALRTEQQIGASYGVLLDWSRAEFSGPLQQARRVAAHLVRLCDGSRLKIAVIAMGLDLYRLAALTACCVPEPGPTVRVFTSTDEARHWLAGDDRAIPGENSNVRGGPP